MLRDEVIGRLAICARILDAWPNSRPLNRDRTLIEYVNATRGVPLGQLSRTIQLAIEAGGDFMPPAGEIVRHAASQAFGGRPVGSDRDAQFWHDKHVADEVASNRLLSEAIGTLDPDRSIEAFTQPQLESGE